MRAVELTRRQALGALATLAFARPARAKTIETDLGTTWWLTLDSAPFPDGRARWRDRTVIAFAPRGLRAAAPVDALVHFHGLNGGADKSILEHRLREQLAESRRNAILVVPQGPMRSTDDVSFGKLERPLGLRTLLADVAAATGAGAIRRVALSAHSGGYQGAARSLERGGCDVSDVLLFDALSGFPRVFREWLAGSAARRLVNYYQGPTTRRYTAKLRLELDRASVPIVDAAAPLPDVRAVFIRTKVPHGEIPSRADALRNCLVTSRLAVIPSPP